MWVGEEWCQTASFEMRKLDITHVIVTITKNEDSEQDPESPESVPEHRATWVGVE